MVIVIVYCVFVFFFFFKQKTAYEIKECDWSSDVCSSDLSPLSRISEVSGYKVNLARIVSTLG